MTRAGGVDGSLGGAGNRIDQGLYDGKAVPDAATLRAWAASIPLVYRAINLRRSQVANAPWAVIPLDPKKPFSQAKLDAIATLLRNPNPLSKNNSFGGMIEPVIDDILTLDLGVILKRRTARKQLVALECLDGARVKFDPSWKGDPKAPRYRYLRSASDYEGAPLLNDELITIVAHPNSHSETGVAPLQVLYRTLTAYQDTMLRVHTVLKSGGPATMVNIAGAGAENLKSIRRRWDHEIVPTSGTVFTDFETDDLKTFQLSSANLVAQGTFLYHDILIREIAAALDVSPFDLMQVHQAQRFTAGEEAEMTTDDGLFPLMRTVQGYLNREVVAEFDEPNSQFVFLDLQLDDEPEAADTIRARFGPQGSWLSVNEARAADGQDAIEIPRGMDEYEAALYTQPRVAMAPGGVAYPVSVAARMMRARVEQLDAPQDGVPANAVARDADREDMAVGVKSLRQKAADDRARGTALLDTELAALLDDVFGEAVEA